MEADGQDRMAKYGSSSCIWIRIQLPRVQSDVGSDCQYRRSEYKTDEPQNKLISP